MNVATFSSVKTLMPLRFDVLDVAFVRVQFGNADANDVGSEIGQGFGAGEVAGFERFGGVSLGCVRHDQY